VRNSRIKKDDSESEVLSDDSVHDLEDNLKPKPTNEHQLSELGIPRNPNSSHQDLGSKIPTLTEHALPRKSILNRRPSSFNQ
jgi:hypothetical protein